MGNFDPQSAIALWYMPEGKSIRRPEQHLQVAAPTDTDYDTDSDSGSDIMLSC